MKLELAKEKISELSGVKFKEYIKDTDLVDIKKNKGKSGQLLEIAIGLNLSNTTLDFEDGELKTNKCSCDGKPKETIFVTQIAGIIDDLLNEKPFYESKLYLKLKNLLYVPVVKENEPEDWMFLEPVQVDLSDSKFKEIKYQLEKDYYIICKGLMNSIENSEDGFIHTTNGEYLQIRSKDSKPYHPIFSQKYGRAISNKNHAFYLKKDFIKQIRNIDNIILV